MYKEKSKFHKGFNIAPVCIMTWVALGYIFSAQAAVVADINQGQIPIVRANSNGSVTVNINSASSAGVSHNKFTQFDITSQGVILNNSTEKVNTTLAGSIAGNKKMAGGVAKLIINEVTSNHISELNGLLEVAGTKADIIVASPAGISCNGCGTINAGHTTLTTGKLIITNGNFNGIDVSNGNITVTGRGMDDKSDYTSLLAKTVKINANLQAKDLQVMAGVNNNIINNNNQQVNTGGTGSASNPSIGLDVSGLGGMYANKITLVTNQSGIGISNSGLISAATDLNINSKGTISNNGRILTDTGDIQFISKNINNNKGLISSGGDVFALADDVNNNHGRISGVGSVDINSVKVNNDQGSIFAEDISIVAGGITNKNSAGYIPVANDKLNNNKGGLYATSDVNINSSATLDSLAGVISSKNGTVSLSSNKNIIIDNSNISAQNINISAQQVGISSMGITDAKIHADGNISFYLDVVGQFERLNIINAGNNININSRDGTQVGYFRNYGVLSAGNNLNFNHSTTVDNYGTITAGKDINFNTVTFANHKIINSGQSTNLSATKSILNDKNGTIISGQKATFSAPTVNNQQGNIISIKGIDVSSNSFFNTGYISGEVIKKPYK